MKLSSAHFIVVFGISHSISAKPNSPPFYVYNDSTDAFVEHYIDLPLGAPSLSATFETDPPKEKFGFHSQSGQDGLILNIFNDKSNGYYVDLAANHYLVGSNTYIFDYFNHWKGVCIEPNPMYLVDLLSHRKCIVVTSPVSKTKGETVTFRFHGTLGGLVGPEFDNQGGKVSDEDKTMVTTTLTSVLDFAKAPSVMDYLSLDVEGAEHYVLAGLDHSKYKFMAVTIERPKPHTHHILAKAGYRFVFQLAYFGECVYLHQSKPDYALLMGQYRQTSSAPNWGGEQKGYLLSPAWDAPYTETSAPGPE